MDQIIEYGEFLFRDQSSASKLSFPKSNLTARTFGNIHKNSVRLQHFPDVLLQACSIIHNLVSVARNLEAFAMLVATNDGNIGQFDLVDRLCNLTRHGRFCL